MAETVAEVRSFNRFYTRQVGLIAERLTGSAFTLAEARLLFEIANGAAPTAADLSRLLRVDKAQVSRILRRLRGQGLVREEPCPHHAKRRRLTLTPQGETAFGALQEGATREAERMLLPLGAGRIGRLREGMATVRAALEEAPADSGFTLRAPRPGDLGWIVHRQAALYAAEYGWDWTYEGLIAGIVGRFVESFDPSQEACWVAERDGRIVGSVFLVRGDEPETAKLRLLYVEPDARGSGIGAALVAACVARAREAGFAALTLWTNSVLVSARRLYERAGFRLTAEEPHRSFGHDLVGQFWRLDLR